LGYFLSPGGVTYAAFVAAIARRDTSGRIFTAT